MNGSAVKRKMGFRKKLKFKALGVLHSLTTDAVPTPKHPKPSTSPEETPSLDELCGLENAFEEKEEAINEIEDMVKKFDKFANDNDDDTNDDHKENDNVGSPEEYDDENYDDFKEPSYKEYSHKSKKTSKEHKKFFKQKSKGSEDNHKNFSYSASSNTYNIYGSKDIHIGPTYEQKVIINGFNGINPMDRSKSPVRETKEIKAIMLDETQITTDLISVVSDHIGYRWKQLGRKFGYTDSKLEQFEMDHKRHNEVVYQLLLDWLQNVTIEATCAKLTSTLWEIEEKQAVQKLANYVYISKKS